MDDLFGLKLQSLSITCPFSPDNQQACKKCPKGTYMPDKQAIQCIPLRGKHRSISIIPYTSYPNATNGTAIGLPIRPGVVPGGSMAYIAFHTWSVWVMGPNCRCSTAARHASRPANAWFLRTTTVSNGTTGCLGTSGLGPRRLYPVRVVDVPPVSLPILSIIH